MSSRADSISPVSKTSFVKPFISPSHTTITSKRDKSSLPFLFLLSSFSCAVSFCLYMSPKRGRRELSSIRLSPHLVPEVIASLSLSLVHTYAHTLSLLLSQSLVDLSLSLSLCCSPSLCCSLFIALSLHACHSLLFALASLNSHARRMAPSGRVWQRERAHLAKERTAMRRPAAENRPEPSRPDSIGRSHMMLRAQEDTHTSAAGRGK